MFDSPDFSSDKTQDTPCIYTYIHIACHIVSQRVTWFHQNIARPSLQFRRSKLNRLVQSSSAKRSRPGRQSGKHVATARMQRRFKDDAKNTNMKESHVFEFVPKSGTDKESKQHAISSDNSCEMPSLDLQHNDVKSF